MYLWINFFFLLNFCRQYGICMVDFSRKKNSSLKIKLNIPREDLLAEHNIFLSTNLFSTKIKKMKKFYSRRDFTITLQLALILCVEHDDATMKNIFTNEKYTYIHRKYLLKVCKKKKKEIEHVFFGGSPSIRLKCSR